eukprot:2732369-Prymnesium_polylepis.1
MKSATEVLWASQLEMLVQEALPVSKLAKAVAPKRGGLFGCCGGGGDVIEQPNPSERTTDDHAPLKLDSINLNVGHQIIASEGDLLREVVDACSWVPLYVASPQWKLKMLIGLAKRGMYNNPVVCDTVSRAVCVQDCGVAVRFLEHMSTCAPAAPLYAAAGSNVFTI